MDQSERFFINGLIRYYQPKTILEIGIAKGDGTVNILNAISDMPNSSLVSIDSLQFHYRDADALVGSDISVYPDMLPLIYSPFGT